MPRTALRTSPLARKLNDFKRSPDGIGWFPLVFLYTPGTMDECDNPSCTRVVEVKQVHLVNGDIVTVRMCWPCAEQVALNTGMGSLPARELPAVV